MPVPPSTIVFAIATAIPFGLAIKDTASGKYDIPPREYWTGRDYEDYENYDGDVEVDEEALEEYGRHQQQMMLERERLRVEARQEIEAARERFPILNAYHLPDGGAARLYPTISPVNTFRVILDRYFGARHDLLPDRSYRASYRDPFRFQPVTVGSP